VDIWITPLLELKFLSDRHKALTNKQRHSMRPFDQSGAKCLHYLYSRRRRSNVTWITMFVIKIDHGKCARSRSDFGARDALDKIDANGRDGVRREISHDLFQPKRREGRLAGNHGQSALKSGTALPQYLSDDLAQRSRKRWPGNRPERYCSPGTARE